MWLGAHSGEQQALGSRDTPSPGRLTMSQPPEAALCPCGGRPLPKDLHCYFRSRTTPPYPSVRVNGPGAFADILNGALGRHDSCRHDVTKIPHALSCDPQGWPAGRCCYLVSATGTQRPRHMAGEGGAGTDAGPHSTCLQAPGGGLCGPDIVSTSWEAGGRTGAGVCASCTLH